MAHILRAWCTKVPHAKTQNDETHPSIQKIKSKHGLLNDFHFKPVTEGEIHKHIKKLGPKKATGVDLIPSKLILAGSRSLSVPIRDMTNAIINRGSFPENLKLAQVTPFYKKMTLSQKRTIGRLASCLPYPKSIKGSLVTNLVYILKIFFIHFLQLSDQLLAAKRHC